MVLSLSHTHTNSLHRCLKFFVNLIVLQAIKVFSDARPPGIYKPDYIDALYAFYHEKKPEMVVCPPIPEWKRSSEFDLNGEAMPDDDDDDGVPEPPHVRMTYKLNLLYFSLYYYLLILLNASLNQGK